MADTLTTSPEARAEREARLRAEAEAIYDEITDGCTRSLRMAELVYAAAERHPDLLPTRAAIDAERELLQKDKQGLEIEQGIFFAHILADPRCGPHLLHAMAQPKPEALDLIAHCRESIAGYKVPKRIEIRDEPLPKSGAGKLLKRELRAPYWEGRESMVSGA